MTKPATQSTQSDLFTPDPARVAAYQAKQDARRERYEARAAAAQVESERRCDAALARSRVMQGEPIKIGHHSERRHRRDIERMNNYMRRSVEAQDKAKHYADKAESVGTGGISSDDPEAIQKLATKIEGAKALQAHMKAFNAAWRKAGKPGIETHEDAEKWRAVAQAQGIGEHEIKAIFGRIGRSFGGGGVPYPPYKLTNNNANIRRMEQRLASLKAQVVAAHEGEAVDEILHGVRLFENHDENRLQLFFDGKPSDECRKALKQNGFKWSRLHEAWQRHISVNALWRARDIIKDHYGEKA